MINNLTGAFLLRGPLGLVLEKAPHAAIGFVERHGLAFIIGMLLWRAEPARLWHGTAVAAHVLLGTSNVVFWPLFRLRWHAGRRLRDDRAACLVRGAASCRMEWVAAGAQAGLMRV